MPTARYPVLLCRDRAGGWSAIAVDDGAVGFAATSTDARTELRDYLRWRYKKTPDAPRPDFRDAELRWFTLTVRPEYRTKSRMYPSEVPVVVRVPVVVGTRASGQPTADVPLLDLRFDYPNRTQLPQLVERYVSQKLEGLTPEELGGYLPPAEVELEEIVVSIPREAVNTRLFAPPPPALARVAEPVGDRAVRKGFARAWSREAEVRSLVHKLHWEKASVLLVGESGVGKTTLMVDAVKEAERLVAERDESIAGGKQRRRFWLTSAGRLVAGMKYLGQWEERRRGDCRARGTSGVLCVECLLELVRRGGVGPNDSIAMFLVPHLARGELRMVAEATPAEPMRADGSCRRFRTCFRLSPCGRSIARLRWP